MQLSVGQELINMGLDLVEGVISSSKNFIIKLHREKVGKPICVFFLEIYMFLVIQARGSFAN